MLNFRRPTIKGYSVVAKTARSRVVNRYRFDYAVEDGFHENEMTLLEAKKLPLPVPETFKHKRLPLDLWYPAHYNDVRFNFRRENWGRRCFVHDNFMNSYDLDGDIGHSLGHRDEDLDYELPDPFDQMMHWKKKRSPFIGTMLMVIWVAIFWLYATVGLKIP